jgi:hypothetical protein
MFELARCIRDLAGLLLNRLGSLFHSGFSRLRVLIPVEAAHDYEMMSPAITE